MTAQKFKFYIGLIRAENINWEAMENDFQFINECYTCKHMGDDGDCPLDVCEPTESFYGGFELTGDDEKPYKPTFDNDYSAIHLHKVGIVVILRSSHTIKCGLVDEGRGDCQVAGDALAYVLPPHLLSKGFIKTRGSDIAKLIKK